MIRSQKCDMRSWSVDEPRSSLSWRFQLNQFDGWRADVGSKVCVGRVQADCGHVKPDTSGTDIRCRALELAPPALSIVYPNSDEMRSVAQFVAVLGVPAFDEADKGALVADGGSCRIRSEPLAEFLVQGLVVPAGAFGA